MGLAITADQRTTPPVACALPPREWLSAELLVRDQRDRRRVQTLVRGELRLYFQPCTTSSMESTHTTHHATHVWWERLVGESGVLALVRGWSRDGEMSESD